MAENPGKVFKTLVACEDLVGKENRNKAYKTALKRTTLATTATTNSDTGM